MKRVKCINASNSIDMLIVGKIYVVEESFIAAGRTWFRLIGLSNTWDKTRFIDLDDNQECPCGIMRAVCEYHKPE